MTAQVTSQLGVSIVSCSACGARSVHDSAGTASSVARSHRCHLPSEERELYLSATFDFYESQGR